MNRFRGFLVPRPDWIKVLYLFGTLGLHRLLTKISKFSTNFKNFSFHRISKLSKNFKILKLKIKIENFHKILKFQKFQNFHKTCSHHVNLYCSLLSQKNQTLMNDWGNSIKMSMRQYSDL